MSNLQCGTQETGEADSGSAPGQLEVLLTGDQFRQLAQLMPRGFALLPPGRGGRAAMKRQATQGVSETELPSGEKRHAYKLALNRISNPSETSALWLTILNKVKKHPKAGHFLHPVDPEAMEIPNYREIVKEPMDLSTVERNLLENSYKSIEEFDVDMQRIFSNAILFNKPVHQVSRAAEEVKAFYLKCLPEKFSVSVGSRRSPKSINPPENEQKSPTLKPTQQVQPLSSEEKIKLTSLIRKKLPKEYLTLVWSIVDPEQKGDQNEFELDINLLSPRTARKLETFVNEKIAKPSSKRKSRTDKSDKGTESRSRSKTARPSHNHNGTPKTRAVVGSEQDSSEASNSDYDD